MKSSVFSNRSRQTRLILETVAIIAGCEGGIMLILPLILPAGSSDLLEAIVDTTMLTLSSGPMLYWRFNRYHRTQKTLLLAEIERRTSALNLTNRQLENQKFALDQHSIVAVTDVQGRITYANDRFCAISGYAREELLGQNHRLIKSNVHPPQVFREMWATITQGRVWHGEVCNRAKDGRLYWVDATITPLLNPQGKPEAYIAIRTDITARKHAETELLRAKEAADSGSRAKSDFLATMSHEIRTPMNGVIGFTDMLLETELTARQRKYVELLRTSGENLLVLINDILDFSKIEAGKLVLENVPCDIRRCAQDVLHLLDKNAHEKLLELELDFSSEVPRWLLGDAVRLRQIILNFVSNALKFTSQGSIRLEGRLESGADGLLLRVSCVDTGIGLAPEQLAKLFQKFSQADSTTTRKFGGTGLGLAICKSLVEAMGGQIGVNSIAGVGSTFWFTVPVRIPDVIPPDGNAGAPTGFRANHRSGSALHASVQRNGSETSAYTDLPTDMLALIGEIAPQPLAPCVLVVDDSEINLMLATSFMHSLGYRTETAVNGRIAVELAAQNSYVLILMDYHMPVLDGCNATIAIRTQAGPNQNTPIVGLSASVDDREHCMVAGMAEFLSKPVRKADLKRILAETTIARTSTPTAS